MRISFNRMELAGSVGDLGAMLPLAFAMIMINGLSPVGVFLTVGVMYIAAGQYYGVPVSVQPMKVVAAYGIAQALSADVITASGIWLAAILLILGATGLVNVVAKAVPKAVIRGVQLATGMLLLSKGAAMVAGTSDFQALRGSVEPFLAMDAVGPLPLSAVIGVVFGGATLFLLNNRRIPAGIVVVGCSALIGCLFGAWRGLANIGFGFHLPDPLPFGLPTGADFSFALLALVLPQIPMTIGNAVIANRDLSLEYFGKSGRRVTDRALCVSMGLANVLASSVGGMPVCHGSGGLAAHYRFGARTHGSNLIIGGAFIVLALTLGDGIMGVLHLIPMGALGVLLFFAGAQLGLTVMDVQSRSDMFIVLAMLGVTLTANLAWGFAAGVCLHHGLRLGRINV